MALNQQITTLVEAQAFYNSLLTQGAKVTEFNAVTLTVQEDRRFVAAIQITPEGKFLISGISS
jgi:hypothetical protein